MTACYLFDCGTPSVCIFSTNSGFTTVQLSARNPHTTELTRVRGNKYITELRSTTKQFLSAASNAWPSTTTTVVDNHYAGSNKTGE